MTVSRRQLDVHKWLQVIQVLFDGLMLRCPRCEHGRMFRRGFKTYHACPVCALEFERASGEITGGMGINTYRSSRGLWASLRYLTGSNTESD